MKTSLKNPPGRLARIATLAIATLGLGAASALALPTVKLDITGQDFGNGNTVTATSAGVISTSPSFSYAVTGTVDGTGEMAGLVQPGTPIASFVNSIVVNGAKKLSGVVPNPNAGGSLSSKITLLSKTYDGTLTIKRVGEVTVSLKVLAEIQTNGKVTLNVTNVSIKKNGVAVSGSIKFRSGSAVTVNTAAEISFKSLNQNAQEDGGPLSLIVLRGKNGTSKVTVDYTTNSGTALAGTDFTAASGKITFVKNQLKATITPPIEITPNSIKNTPRKFTVTLSNPTGGAVITKGTETITIIDND